MTPQPDLRPPPESDSHVGQGMTNATRLSPRDLYRLRRVRLAAERATLKARMAHHFLEMVTLELERRYGLLGLQVTVDPTTGTIAQDGSRNEASGPPSLNPRRCPDFAVGSVERACRREAGG